MHCALHLQANLCYNAQKGIFLPQNCMVSAKTFTLTSPFQFVLHLFFDMKLTLGEVFHMVNIQLGWQQLNKGLYINDVMRQRGGEGFPKN